jgi:hypothetical protein
MQKALKMHPEDNVAVVLQATPAHTSVILLNQKESKEFLLRQAIESYHKFALKTINLGEEIIKYGEVIGVATKSIAVGEHVHTHNVRSIRV